MKKYYSLQSFFWYLRQFRTRLTLVFLAFAVADMSLTVMPVFIGRLIGALSARPANTHMAWLYVGVLVGLSILHSIAWHGSELLYVKYINPMSFNYETAIAREVLQKPYPFFVGKFTGKISSYITLIGKETREFMSRVMYNYSQGVVKLITITSILFSVNTPTGLIFAGSLLLMLFIGRFSIQNSTKYESIFTDVESDKNGIIIDIVSNYVNVKSFKKEAREGASIAKEQQAVVTASRRSFLWGIFFWASMSTVVRMVIWPATVIVNVYFYLHGTISLAQLTTLLSTILLFSGQIWEFIWYISQFNLAMSRLEEAHRYLFGKKVVHTGTNATTPVSPTSKPLTFTNQLELRNLDFAYPDQPDELVLKGVNLTIHKGEKVGIVGKSGSGKTTFVKLLLGYYDLPEWAIVLDGTPVSNTRLLDIISYVPQDTTLFNRTIAENIAYAVGRDVTREEIVQASVEALADEFIQRIPGAYDAVVGERGVKLSTGQRQRIAIARAILQKTPLLILDEATSALDSENETLVQISLEHAWEEHTVVSIAHRLSTLRKMDRIVVFYAGTIVEQGSIDELLAARGVFYDLWNHQVNGMIVE